MVISLVHEKSCNFAYSIFFQLTIRSLTWRGKNDGIKFRNLDDLYFLRDINLLLFFRSKHFIVLVFDVVLFCMIYKCDCKNNLANLGVSGNILKTSCSL